MARHIVRTGGLLCSSCQVIYLDTDRLEEGEAFCQAFLPLLNQAARERNRDGAAQAALYTHTYRLERLAEGGRGQDLVRGGQLPHFEARPGAGALPPYMETCW